MAVFKCKMCGGALEINSKETVVTCEYCGTQQTLPKLDDDRRANLYDRANHFRRNNEFDKAMGIYEQILNEDNTDAEAYWSIVLCRYGIEYVEDPSSHKRIPTINRAQFTSVFDDDNYKSALQCADSYQRIIYEEEAKAINEIQKGILAISQKEEPFDVFICYKETDNNGRRTPDSVLANDLYHQLTQEGFKVFFARITLEDKLGSAYEPYIFAALNSAKVMVVLGTKPEYFNAVWVKNEWSRYLSLIKQGQKKMLIPAYKDMDPYDLPEEFSHLQAQDMSKLGFMQDLIRGIKKIVQTDEPKATVVKETVVTTGNTNTAALLKRAFIFLEDGDWTRADDFCEQVLNQDPENAQAYLGKLMAELRVKHRENLKDRAELFIGRNNFQKAMRFGDDALKKELQGYIYDDAVSAMESASSENDFKRAAAKFDTISGFKDAKELSIKCRENAEEARMNAIYNDAIRAMESANSEDDYKRAATKFGTISDFKDAKELSIKCLENAVEARMKVLYENAKKDLETAIMAQELTDVAKQFEAISEYRDSANLAKECREKADAKRKDAILSLAQSKISQGFNRPYQKELIAAIDLLKPISGWRNADELISSCKNKLAEFEAQEEAERREYAQQEILREIRKKIRVIIAAVVIVAAVAAALLYILVIRPTNKYNNAVALMESGQYNEAISAFEALDGYKDSVAKIDECIDGKYNAAVALMEASNYSEAIAEFEALGAYKDSASKIDECNVAITEIKYNNAVALMEASNYSEAIAAFEVLGAYKDSASKIDECNAAIIEIKYNNAVALMKESRYEEAIAAFKALNGYKDSATKTNECTKAISERDYNAAVALMKESRYEEAIAAFKALNGYKDSATKINECTKAMTERDYNKAAALLKEGKRQEAAFIFGGLGDYKDAQKLWMTASSNTIAAGEDHALGLKSDGTVKIASNHRDAEISVGKWSNIVSVAVRNDTLVGLKSDGTVVAFNADYYSPYGQTNVSDWCDIVAVAAGGLHTVGLKSDGTVVAVGKNDNGQCNVSGWTDIVAVAAGTHHTVGLKSDGTVVAVGYNAFGECKVSGWTDIVAVAAGGYYTIGLKSDGTVVAVGDNDHGQCNVSGWHGIVAVVAGSHHTVGLKSDGTVIAVGLNERGRCNVGGWTNIAAVAAGDQCTIGLKSDGTVVYVGSPSTYLKETSDWPNIKTP